MFTSKHCPLVAGSAVGNALIYLPSLLMNTRDVFMNVTLPEVLVLPLCISSNGFNGGVRKITS